MVEPNNPIVVAAAIVLIAAAIVLVGGLKAGTVGAPAQQNNVGSGSNPATSLAAADEKAGYTLAPELAGITGYINTPKGTTLSSFRGKVVLLDFWTYTCINCIRTLPYLESWYEKYSGKGLVVLGVHSPEFDFEKDYANVSQATSKYGIKYPVVLDSDHATWDAYQNQYWPHEYLIDQAGYIRHDRIGEGGYDETEQEIVKLLQENDSNTQNADVASEIPKPDLSGIGTPEIYLGYGFARQEIGNPEGFQPGQTVHYSIPSSLQPNLVYFEGAWKNNSDNMELASGTGKMVLLYTANKANIVAGSDQASSMRITLDGNPIGASTSGSDATSDANGFLVRINAMRLYNLASTKDSSQKRLELDVSGKGFQIFTFTFG